MKDGFDITLVRHIDMNLFRFFVDSLSWPMMQYKVFPRNLFWCPVDAPPIRLWKANPDRSPKLPTCILSPIPY